MRTLSVRAALALVAALPALSAVKVGQHKLAAKKPLNFTAILSGDAWRRKKAQLKEESAQAKANWLAMSNRSKEHAQIQVQKLRNASSHPRGISFSLFGSKAAKAKVQAEAEAEAIANAKPGPLTAMCLAGNLRTFGRPTVYNSVRPFLEGLGGSGIANESIADVFLFGTLASEEAKQQRHFSFAALNVSRTDVSAAIDALSPVSYVLSDSAHEVTKDNIDDYVANRNECFTGFADHTFWSDINLMARSLNQLTHMQKCIDLISANEVKENRTYEVVILSRPDLSYYDGKPPINLHMYKGKLLHQWDWFMVLPRALAANFTNPATTRPLRCSPGQRCCNKIFRSEAMFEYLLGAPMELGGTSCDCADFATDARHVEVANLVRTEKL